MHSFVLQGSLYVYTLCPLTTLEIPSLPPSSSASDRLGELERDKARLSEQLIAQQREHLVREMDILKRSKGKNLLKKGFKKLKGKIQVHRTAVKLGCWWKMGRPKHFVLLARI